MKTLLNGGTIINQDSTYQGWIIIEGDKIVEMGQGEYAGSTDDMCIMQCDGAYLIPGVIDSHVHFREPGMSQKANWATESRAALRGGVTSVVDMPNVKPPTTTIEALDEKAAIARAASLVNYGFWFGADGHNMAQMRQAVKRTDVAGIKVFMGSSTGSLLVDSADALCKILENIPAPVAVHAEDEAIIRANRQDAVARYRHDKQVPLTEHRRIRSTQACRAAVRTAVDAQGWCGGQLHVLHISSEGELAEMEGTDTIAEVCVGHLWFTDDDMKTLGAKIKVNPAIKTDSDRRALRRAVRQGQIAIINTDHAPHLLADKKGGALVAASGMPIIQFGLPMMFELADRGVFTHQQVVACMCHNPAKLLGIEGRGVLVPGYYADIAVVYPDAEYTVQDADVASLCGWTPMAGQTLHNMVVATFVNGQLAYSQATDTYEAPDAAMPLKFTRR